MKKFQQLCAAVVLTLALALSVIAGDIGTPGVSSPPPPPRQSSMMGDIGTPGIAATNDLSTSEAFALDRVTQITLKLLESVIFIF